MKQAAKKQLLNAQKVDGAIISEENGTIAFRKAPWNDAEVICEQPKVIPGRMVCSGEKGGRRVRLQALRAYGREDLRGNLQDQPRRGAHHQANGAGELYLQPRPGQAGHAALPQGRAQGADCRIQGGRHQGVMYHSTFKKNGTYYSI